jgi:hypothetical protein
MARGRNPVLEIQGGKNQEMTDDDRTRTTSKPKAPGQIPLTVYGPAPGEELDATDIPEASRNRVSNSNNIIGKDNYKGCPIEWIPKLSIDQRKRTIVEILTEHFRKRGYIVTPQYSLKGLARVDLYAIRDHTKLFIEVKEYREANNHSIVTGVGQLLFDHFLDPSAKLFLAIPKGCHTRKIVRSKSHLRFLGCYHIRLIEV